MINGVSETTVYAGGYEAITSGGITKYRHHLMADGREVAEVDLWVSGSTTQENVSYVFSDHLGSVDVVQTTSASGTVLSTTDMSFGAWGNRREPGTWVPPVGATETQTDHNANRYGFTHQEMLDNVNLIHMNGRVYDPTVGRFLSVDPIYQAPRNSQTLNPYSYVMNNPLSLTDPSGYAAACPDETQSGCAGDSKTISYIPTGSHIATTVTATVQKDGSVAITSNSPAAAKSIASNAATMFGGGNGQENSSQSSNSAQNKPTDTAGIGSPQMVAKKDPQQSGGGGDQQGHTLTDQQLQQFNKMTYSGTQGNESGVETVYTTDADGKTLIKTQAGCEEEKCSMDNPPAGSVVGGHTHVYPEGLRGLRVGQVTDPSQKAAMMARDMPGPGDAAFSGGPGELITPGNEHYSFEGTPENTTMRYRGGGDSTWGQFVEKNWHAGMTDQNNVDLANSYLKPPQ